MTKQKLYLAGPMTPDWREGVIRELEAFFIIYNPIKDSRQDCQIHYVADDIEAARSSNFLLAYQPGDQKPCLGMAVEAALCFENKGMVVYTDESSAPDPLMIGISKRSFAKLEDAVHFLKCLAT
ncbi:MAG: hypothetical protein Q8L34_00550 [Candidatus Woesearchaeota archaeon]|nr:hypothetical protein [Candidatus Woesearchaeota archaeon]